MTSQFKKATIETIGGGAIPELFQRELQAVLANIADQNTPSATARSITIKVIIKPTADRDSGSVEVRCQASMPSVKPVAASMFFGREGGKLVGLTHNPKQMDMFEPKVVEMGGGVNA